MSNFFPKLTATGWQAATYLLGIALFSISFLVFLNSSISFVITEVIGQKERVGDAVGTLGFADELLALVACPLWGLLSDRIGVRNVAVLGYCIVSFSLVCLVQSSNVYPDLLFGRLIFSLGGAACSTMVTAVLPAMLADKVDSKVDEEQGDHSTTNSSQPAPRAARAQHLRGGHAATPSVNSQITITPTRFASHDTEGGSGRSKRGVLTPEQDLTDGTSQLAGFVGFFTGAGALIALAIFLPLPTYFQDKDHGQAASVRISFYIVAAIAFCVAIFIFIGLRGLPGEEDKSWSSLLRPPYDEATDVDEEGNLHTTLSPAPSYLRLISEAVKLGFTDPAIGLGYLGGFVARASSVAISLFIPLFVNAYFVRNGLCKSNPDNLMDIKEQCKRAYKLAAALSGICETAALLCAPLFGWAGGTALKGKAEWPLLLAAAVGVAGYVAFGLLSNPDAFHGEGGQWAILSVILIGISQIGAIVCSLGLLGRGISGRTINEQSNSHTNGSLSENQDRLTHSDGIEPVTGEEVAPLLPSMRAKSPQNTLDRSRLKGTIAGVYSLLGGAGILLLTKLGGALFDSWIVGAPFFLMAISNALLFVAILLVSSGRAIWQKVKHS